MSTDLKRVTSLFSVIILLFSVTSWFSFSFSELETFVEERATLPESVEEVSASSTSVSSEVKGGQSDIIPGHRPIPPYHHDIHHHNHHPSNRDSDSHVSEHDSSIQGVNHRIRHTKIMNDQQSSSSSSSSSSYPTSSSTKNRPKNMRSDTSSGQKELRIVLDASASLILLLLFFIHPMLVLRRWYVSRWSLPSVLRSCLLISADVIEDYMDWKVEEKRWMLLKHRHHDHLCHHRRAGTNDFLLTKSLITLKIHSQLSFDVWALFFLPSWWSFFSFRFLKSHDRLFAASTDEMLRGEFHASITLIRVDIEWWREND